MASINYAARQISVKIVYYGPGLSGKTTNLQVIHKKTPQEHRSDMVSLATETDRTLFFDFLPLDLGKIKGFDTKFQLYTVPGQVYYNATRKLVLRGVDGVVFVADSGADKIQENLESFQNLEDNLAEYGYQRESIPIILQYNKRDLPNALPIEELQRHINKYNLPYGEGIAYKGVGVFDTLKQVGKVVIDYLNKKYSRSSGARSAAPEPSAHFGGQSFAPPPAPAYQAPQSFAPPPQVPAYQAPQSFAPPPAPAYQAPQSFAPPPQVPAYQAPQSFAPPPAPAYQAPQSFTPQSAQSYQQQQYDTFEASFEPQSFEASAPAYQAPQAAQSFEPSFDPFAAPQSFEPPPQSFDPFAAPQAASAWGEQSAAPGVGSDPFLSVPNTPSFEMQSPPPAMAAPPSPAASMSFDDAFMVEPQAAQTPPPMQGMPPQQQQAGGFEQSPFDFEMAPPPPPPFSTAPQAGRTGGKDFNMGQQAPPPAAASQSDFSFDYQPFAPQTNQNFNGAAARSFGNAAPAMSGFSPSSGGQSDLDIEIEQYQHEIEEKQKKMHSSGTFVGFQPSTARQDTHEMQPYTGPGENRHPTPQAFAPIPFQPSNTPPLQSLSVPPTAGAVPGGVGATFSDFEAELEGSATRSNYPIEAYPTDSAMFFTSVAKNAAKANNKKPVKPPINPVKRGGGAAQPQQPPKGFGSKLFNKN